MMERLSVQETFIANLATNTHSERHDNQSISRTHAARISPLLTITILLLAFVLASCSTSGPSDEYLLSDFAQDGLSNIEITHKGQCDSISPTARVRGIDEAWLVMFEYDSTAVGHVVDYPVLYVKVEGVWHHGSGYYDEQGWPRCP